ncbi:MAG: glutamate synthase large subunit [Polyangiaceae bacterium]
MAPSKAADRGTDLYDSNFEHDACGVGFLAKLKGGASHDVVARGVSALEKMEHRGATGADPTCGDGAGVLIEIPHELLEREVAISRVRISEGLEPLSWMPPRGGYGVAAVFQSKRRDAALIARTLFGMIVRQEGCHVVGWRRVPTDARGLGEAAREVEPILEHAIVVPRDEVDARSDALERKLFVIRKRFEDEIRRSSLDDKRSFYISSLSTRTVVYKGMLTPGQVRPYFTDLADPLTASRFAIFHSRFSTNTFPSWPLAHPYRMIAHNGEINTLRGNVNFMRAREAMLDSDLFGADIQKLLPVVYEGLSDSACLDSVLELLVMGGRSLPHALMMLIPEAWEKHATMSETKRAFYAYHSCLVEPWDGPACVCATDGKHLAAVLDRNGLRPARYAITESGYVGLASEVGVFGFDERDVTEKGRVGPGRMFLVDLEAGRVVPDEEIKESIATAKPYGEWLADNLVRVDSLPSAPVPLPLEGRALLSAQRAFGLTEEDKKWILEPMADKGEELTGSMGNDAALAILSTRPRRLFDYFQQLFAQVTNPPLDAIREELLTSIATAIGPEQNLLDPQPAGCRLIHVESPFLDASEMAKLRSLALHPGSGAFADDPPPSTRWPSTASIPPGERSAFRVTDLEMLFPAKEGPEGLEPALMSFFAKADVAIENGANVLVLTDRGADRERAPIPSLLAIAGLHNHLVRAKTRTRATLLVETGDATEVHHFAALVGYGASAIHPWLALDSVGDDARRKRYLKAVAKGVVKVMSKMGISTISSYRGAQIFEALGLSKALVDRHFTHTPSRIGGIGLRDIARDVLENHRKAYSLLASERSLETGGQYQWRRDGEKHLFTPETIWKLQHATRTKQRAIFKEYTEAVDAQADGNVTLRSLMEFLPSETPVPVAGVEPAADIMRRFATGAMSYGSISAEAHETLAIAMNRIGGRSNSGEGGEAAHRSVPDANGDDRRSRVKQVASARFGVTSAYLVSADEIQIKIAQGAKPGEGGQLPGNKVYPWIAEVRHATPGVGLISPPPHHDIYSIEDLAQLIYDLKNANPLARISVKLVSEVGVGTVAAGVAKAKADAILISGHDGGTGASPIGSLKHAGLPWELGLAEAQQTLMRNGLRDRVVLQVDGQLRTGRDVIVAALLGAEEFGFATAPLVVMGCVMMRVCHLDTCPVGIATQNPKLRELFAGRAEHVVNFFRFIADEVREILASLGARSLQEVVGRVDLLGVVDVRGTRKYRGLSLERILSTAHLGEPDAPRPRTHGRAQAHDLERTLDRSLVTFAKPALTSAQPVEGEFAVTNEDRAVGTMLGSHVTRAYGAAGLPPDTISLTFRGSAGQSFGAFLPRGITLRLEGEANDYVGKGLSGGRIVVLPPPQATRRAEQNVIAGNVVLYGATSGDAFIRGVVGERFAVRNSGARVVVEGVGDHGCEYMTGGVALVLGSVGRNFAAGMSGGVAYVLADRAAFEQRCNTAMVDVEELDDEDRDTVRDLAQKHADLTGSDVARGLLAIELRGLLKVIPRDYRRALAEKRAAAAAAVVDAAAAE